MTEQVIVKEIVETKAQLSCELPDIARLKSISIELLEAQVELKEHLAERIPTINDWLEGQRHPITDVPFAARLTETNEGKLVEVVVPEFHSDFDAQLPEDLLTATDKKQFDECALQLREAITNNPELTARFDDIQLEQINNSETPDGFVWHHDATVGKMQLVNEETHVKTGHTGGKYIWGGGSENR